MPAERAPAFAGRFYPRDPRELERAVEGHLAIARRGSPAPAVSPRILIAPHAGYGYSGPVAASAFASLADADIAAGVDRVVLIGPSHYVSFDGLAVSGAAAFATPLGRVAVDRGAESRLAQLWQVATQPEVHAGEHALEVELPFLQRVLGRFELVPILAGDAEPHQVAEALDVMLGGPEGQRTLLVVSSDLSHFLDYEAGRRRDRQTAARIAAAEAVGPYEACGWVALNGLAAWLRSRGAAAPVLLDLRSSGDTGGPRDSVVGYGAFAAG